MRAAGCQRVYAEKVSGKSTNGRNELAKALKALEPGDTLVVVKLDRLARSIRDLLSIIDQIKASGAKFKALDDSWCDTTTPQGELFLTIMGGLGEFERKLIKQRCDDGIARAKAMGLYRRARASEKISAPVLPAKLVAQDREGGERDRRLKQERADGQEPDFAFGLSVHAPPNA